ncbi:MAG: hypothetical protein II939_02325 [Bacteroidales bacterium]|nr:hypothetical protein [Bacteroidales bacterium]
MNNICQILKSVFWGSMENIVKIDSAGYGYLFRGKIYSAAETETYWDIIEQYKLRQ